MFIVADPVRHRDALLQLNVEFMTWNSSQLESMFGLSLAQVSGMSVHEYVAGTIDKVCGEGPPRGIFYLLEADGEVTGMGGLRTVREGVCELKRFYIRPAFRGKGFGEALLSRTFADAASFGFQKMLLDSGPFMHAAHRLYLSNGFKDCAPYPESEAPIVFHDRWRFMEKSI